MIERCSVCLERVRHGSYGVSHVPVGDYRPPGARRWTGTCNTPLISFHSRDLYDCWGVKTGGKFQLSTYYSESS